MKDDPVELYDRLPRIHGSAQQLFLRKVKRKADGDESLPRNQMKVMDYRNQRFLSIKDNSSQTRFLAVRTNCCTRKSRTRTLFLIISGIEGKKENDIPEGNLIRAKNRWIEVEQQVTNGDLKIGGW